MSDVTKKHDVVCNGCGGKSGTHTDTKCPFLVDRLLSAIRRNGR